MEQTLNKLMFNSDLHYYGIGILRCLILIKLFLLSNFLGGVMTLPTCSDRNCVLQSSEVILQEEDSLSSGNSVRLNEKEKMVNNNILAPIKEEELLNSHQLSEKSKVFQFIRNMPKGGNLHFHDTSMVNVNWVITEMTYLPNLYYCGTQGGRFLRFRYSDMVPEREEFCDDSWISVKERREKIGPEQFDKMLYHKMTMVREDLGPQGAWDNFVGKIICIADLMYSEIGFSRYVKQALRESYEDHVMYVEVRTLMSPILSNSGRLSSREDTLLNFIKVAEEFKRENPGFVGAKFIFVSIRGMSKDILEKDIRTAMELHKKYPKYLIGYDMVKDENRGPPYTELLDILFIPSQHGVHLPFFFHAGETNRFGNTDKNILSAILLNSTRIGHAFALTKHPLLMDMVKERDIAIEVNPISNQVLNLVSDLRNHPGAVFFAKGLPVVICSDDPATWKTSGLTYDYHAAFMAFTKAKDGLEVLKEMSRNGIKYSAMTEDEKKDAFIIWQQKWDEFVDSFLPSKSTTDRGKGQRDEHKEL